MENITCVVKHGYMLETLRIQLYLNKVKISLVQTISREDLSKDRNPQRLHAMPHNCG